MLQQFRPLYSDVDKVSTSCLQYIYLSLMLGRGSPLLLGALLLVLVPNLSLFSIFMVPELWTSLGYLLSIRIYITSAGIAAPFEDALQKRFPFP